MVAIRARFVPCCAVAAFVAISPFLATSPLQAQTRPEPSMEALLRAVQHDWLTFGMLLQVVADPSLDGSDSDPASVQLAAARLRLSGVLDGGFEYFIQTNFAASPSILDARVGWRFSDALTISAGRFKTPFSREFLTYAGSIDFVNRARAVETLAPGRQMGVQLRGQAGSVTTWSLGSFTGSDNSPENESLIGVARLEVTPMIGDGDVDLSVGVSGAVGRDGAVAGRALSSGYLGDGVLYGLDGRLTAGRLLVAGEVIVAEFDPVASSDVDAAGTYVTAGWMTAQNSQVLLRWDRYRPIDSAAENAAVLGFNVWPTTASEIQVNWIAPVGGSDVPHKLLVNFQLGF